MKADAQATGTGSAFIERSEMLRGSPLRGWSGRFFHAANMTFAHWDIADGASDLHEHRHPQEEVWNIVEGEVMLTIGAERRRLGPGAVGIVPANAPHSAQPVGSCRAIIVDYPRRTSLPGVSDPNAYGVASY
jgi:mannose-6-phosphate isomerase-like protein (cupin superfamily)